LIREQTYGVRQRASYRGEVFDRTSRASRQIDYQRPPAYAAHGARERRKRRGIQAAQSHQLRKAGSFALYHRASGFGRVVARGESRPACGQYQIYLSSIGKTSKARSDPFAVIRYYFLSDDLAAEFFYLCSDCGAGLIDAFAARAGIAYGENRCNYFDSHTVIVSQAAGEVCKRLAV
jgi:hypothetical protein